MKKFLLLSLITALIGLVIGFVLVKNNKKTETDDTKESSIPVPMTVLPDGTFCFARSQIATDTAPYKVEEHIVLHIKGNTVTGTKNGTQSGPDMTNGYEGTLTGTKTDDTIEATYAYTVEGSKNKELEIYKSNVDSLIKSRWPLVEQSDVLIPDKTGAPQLLTYIRVPCK